MEHQKKRLPQMVKPLKTGELLVKEGLINHDDIKTVLSIQRKRQDSLGLNKPRLFGMILCDLNLVTPVDNYWVLHKYNKIKSVPSALVSKQMLSKEIVLNAQKESQELNVPFISHLLKNKLISSNSMQKLLFELFHIPFRSIRDFIFNKNMKKELFQVLDKHPSRKTGIIPMVLKDNTILFGITEPDNILFIQQLNDRFPQYRFKTVFIPYSRFLWFHKIIYGNNKNFTAPKEEPIDLSLLLSFRATVKNPETENGSLEILYNRYELLRHLIGNKRFYNRLNEFNEFIAQTHKKITNEYKCQSIEFSLRKADKSVRIIALPKK
ncbi:MAG: hypothetical protein GY699_20015 [Desulfobacteraceae bacterium]|nr:hypothetical protein [Desulfobacteraceae bacterium]